jgi:hypothetical protein
MSQQDRTQLLELNRLIKVVVQNTLHNSKASDSKERAAAKLLLARLLGRSPTDEDFEVALTV